MGHDPELVKLRHQAPRFVCNPFSSGKETIDNVALVVSLIFVSGVVMMVLYLIQTSPYPIKYEGIFLILLFGIPLAFLAGSILTYTSYFGAIFIMNFTKRFWWAFVLAGLGLFYWFQN